MQIVHYVEELRGIISEAKKQGKSIGFVPTMGYLHEGHLSLARRARGENGLVVMSIFVNPLQFGVNEDYEDYPRDLSRDAPMAEAAGVDVLFCPGVADMYPRGYATFVEVEEITAVLCGASRPGHFRGVTTVVAKLFGLVRPDRAYFGQKDAQQLRIIEKMVEDLNMPVEIVPCPTVREPDGLAMSSRNAYLSPREREAALVLNRSLRRAEEAIRAGERDANRIREQVAAMIREEPLAQIDYVSVNDGVTLREIERMGDRVMVALAVRIGMTRLIDNLQMNLGGEG